MRRWTSADSRRSWLWLLGQFGLVLLGVLVYFGVRGLTRAEPSTAVRHAQHLVNVERSLGLEHEAGVQHVVVRHGWLTDLANWIYIWGHWPVIAVVLIWLAMRHRVVYLRLRNAMVASGAVGCVVFATYPVAPPRLMSLGLIDTVTQRSSAYRVLQPPAFVNQYAALPSLHVGWDLLVGLAVASAASTAVVRWLGRLMPVLMALAVVATANHYIVDGIVGAVLALGGLALALRLEHQREKPQPFPCLPRPRPAPDQVRSPGRSSLAS